MVGELTDKETIKRIDEILENHYQDQFEILLYKKNSELSNDIYVLFIIHSFPSNTYTISQFQCTEQIDLFKHKSTN